MEDEIWKPIPEYEKYEASNLGRIRSLLDCRGNVLSVPRILKDAKNNRDYHCITLCKDGIPKQYLVHRLVGITFIENPEKKKTIDHIDKNKSNNQVSNLRWLTNDEQIYNKTYPLGKSNEKYINLTKRGSYRFRIENNSVYIHKTFKTLEEAVNYRNTYLTL